MKRRVIKLLSQYDILSEEVKLNSVFSNNPRPKKVFGGVLSLIAFFLSLAMATFMLSSLFIRTSPKAYEVTRFLDDTPRIYFNNENNFFIIRFYSPIFPKSFIHFSGKMVTVKSQKIVREYGFDPCIYDQDFEGLQNFFPHDQKEDLETNYYCVSKMYLNGPYFFFW